MFGMPSGFAELLRRKYDIMQQGVDVQKQNADTSRVGTEAQARLDNVRAGLLPKESAAQIGLTDAQAGLAKANTANVNETTKYVGPLANASIFETRSRGRLYGAQATGEDQLNGSIGKGMDPLSFRGLLTRIGIRPGLGLPEED